MAGVVTGRHILRHSVEIITGFGLPFYCRCLWALASRRRVTFLGLLSSH